MSFLQGHNRQKLQQFVVKIYEIIQKSLCLHVAGAESRGEREAGAGKGTTCGADDPALKAAQPAG